MGAGLSGGVKEGALKGMNGRKQGALEGVDGRKKGMSDAKTKNGGVSKGVNRANGGNYRRRRG